MLTNGKRLNGHKGGVELMKVIVSGIKQRHCGRWFYFDSHGRWNLMYENNPDIAFPNTQLVREIRKTKYVVTKYIGE